MLVRELMTEDVACVTRDARLSEVAQLMRDKDCGEIPIVSSAESRELVGVVTDRDIVIRVLAMGRNPLDCDVSEAMTERVIVARPEMDIVEAARLMGENQVRRIVAVDDNNCLLGILSLADVSRHAGENVVGATVQDISEPSSKDFVPGRRGMDANAGAEPRK